MRCLEQRETLTAASLEAASSYFRGQDLQLQVKYDEAIKAYEEAIRLDASFGRAYSGLGVIYRNQGQRDEAEKYLKVALQRIGQMSLREQFRTRGAYFVTVGNFSKGVEEYSTLVEKFPADNVGHANLAICYLYLRKLERMPTYSLFSPVLYYLGVARQGMDPFLADARRRLKSL